MRMETNCLGRFQELGVAEPCIHTPALFFGGFKPWKGLMSEKYVDKVFKVGLRCAFDTDVRL